MADKIQIRRDIAANWTSANPVLSEGEIGLEMDTKKQKVGNGFSTWNSLPYWIEDERTRKITVSDSPATGGDNGDVWLEY